MRWKNERPQNNEAYVPTNIEQLANIVTHGACLPLFVYHVLGMLDSVANMDQDKQTAALIYGIVIIGLFSTSTCFHTISLFCQTGFLKNAFHRGDRAMIYLFIAGSYTPWLMLKAYDPPDGWASQLKWQIWVLAFMGILYQQAFHEKYKWLETTFYVIIGLAPSYAVFEMVDSSGLSELRYGGVAYLGGVFFFKSDGKIPFAHAIWHLHVVYGATIHFQAVMQHLLHL